MPKTKLTKCSCPKTKKGQKKKNAPLCAYCQELEPTKNQPATNSAKAKPVKKSLLKTWSFWKYLLLITSFSSGSIGGYFWAKEKFFTSPEIPNPETPTEEEREISDRESSSEEIIEPESSILDPNAQIYFTQIITRIHNGTITNPEEAVVLKTPAQRKTVSEEYLSCSLAECLLSIPRKICPHGNYFACSVETCPFFELETSQFADYCAKHACQTHGCQQLVVIYQDGSREKFCQNCLSHV